MIVSRMVGRPPRSLEKDEVLAGARRRLEEADAIIKGPNRVRHQAFVALIAIGRMFSAAKPALDRMSEDDRAAWQTRKKLLEQWLSRIGERMGCVGACAHHGPAGTIFRCDRRRGGNNTARAACYGKMAAAAAAQPDAD